MRAILITLALLLGLTACASTPAPITATAAGSAKAGINGFATLATFGTWEMDLAPAYTRLAAVRHNAARLLETRRINVTIAEDVQATADAARALLDQSRRGTSTSPTKKQRDDLAAALVLIAQAEHLLEH